MTTVPIAAPKPVRAGEVPLEPMTHDREGLGMRTPSPTPTELAELAPRKKFDYSQLFRKDRIAYTLILSLVIAIVILLLVFETSIVHFIAPAARKIHNLKAGWLIPVAILIIWSFPPLLGQEIIGALCGFVWGLGVGFAIVAAGTIIGESLNYFAFRHWCMTRGQRREKKVIGFACMARIVRDNGFKVVLAARYSILPSHYCTAVFATCGISLRVFLITIVLALPQQLSLVYAGWVVSPAEKHFSHSGAGKAVNAIVLVVNIGMTVFCGQYLQKKIGAVKPDVIYDRRKARQAAAISGAQGDSTEKLDEASGSAGQIESV